MTREEWRRVQEAREREEQERRDARYFADAAAIMADEALDTLETWDEERRIHTRLLEDLKADAQSVYRSWRDGNPEMTAALVAAGRNYNCRLQRRLEKYIEGMAAEVTPVQRELHREVARALEPAGGIAEVAR